MTESTPETVFRQWLQDHSGVVLKVARAYTWSAEDSQDLAQEILVQIWRSVPRFQGRSSPATWIYRVALNTALTWNRKERRRRELQQPIFEVSEMPAPASTEITHQVHTRELMDQLYDAIRRLAPADAALVLLYLDDLSYKEIGDILGISEGNVGVKLNRAKKALSDIFKTLNSVQAEELRTQV